MDLEKTVTTKEYEEFMQHCNFRLYLILYLYTVFLYEFYTQLYKYLNVIYI